MIDQSVPLQRRYLELSLQTPGYYGEHARARLAKYATLPDAFFNYDENNTALNKPADVRIFGDFRRVRIVGIGEAGIDAIGTHAIAIAQAFRNREQPLPPWMMRDGDFHATTTREAQHYAIASFVVKLSESAREHAKSRAFDHPELVGIVHKRLDDALARQCAFLGINLVPTVDAITITKSVPVLVKHGRFFAALSVSFESRVRLRGPWQLGRLQARGYGLVYAR
jgi:hypothetical protein